MTSPFDVILAAADSSLLTTFGERIKVVPRVVETRRPAGADINRDEGIIRGIFTQSGLLGNILGKAAAGAMTVQLAEAASSVWFPKASLDELGYLPVDDDVIVLVDRDEDQEYIITHTYPSDSQDIVAFITRKTG